MTNLGLESSIVEWVIEYPEVQCVLDSMGIDQSCQGKSLEYVCRQMGLEPHFVLKQLQDVLQDDSTVNE
ncbi:hypothetical protein [uncultured Gimesia sp.]|jgi:iron-sulfur cluster repair protein YtfE (RIC family)|uniref:hypothetical protein n=1 Tax=uncultured Gimesia sp. TaxID=1678688 RepID=UPI00261DF275|nr:hypothetical protein [uncultured Gimesia sp.]